MGKRQRWGPAAACALASVLGCASHILVDTGGAGAGSPGAGGAGAGGTGASSTTSGSGAAGVHAEPPGPGPIMPANGAGSVTLAMTKLYLGDTDPDGTPDKVNGWKYLGYDLDGKISTATSTDLCKTRDGASPKNVYPDGIDGIDNSFGKLILPIFLGLSSSAIIVIEGDIAAGKYTFMLDMQKLGPGSDANPVLTSFFAGGDLMATPKLDGTDKWPVMPELLNDGMTIAGGSKVSFPMSYVSGNTWVSGSKATLPITVVISGYPLVLNISNAVVSVELSANHETGAHGVIAGVLNTVQLVSELQAMAGNIDTSLCSGPTITSILDQVTQASDILSDGTQDPTKDCDAISIGIGFDAARVQLGAVLPPAPPAPSKCAGGG